MDDDYLGLDDLGFTLALYPSFKDLDGDGDQDLIIGDLNGLLHYFENTAGLGNTAIFSLSIPGIPDNTGEVIDIGQFATPFIVDINRDGKMDMIIGERAGNLNYYQNTGSNETFEFTLIDDTFGGVEMPGNLNEGFSVPFIIDSEEGYHLMVGSNMGEVVHFYPIEDDLSSDFPVENDNILPFYEGKRSGVVIADIANTEGLEMIVGNYRGGLGYYKQTEMVGIDHQIKPSSPFNIFPNPTKDILNLSVPKEIMFSYSIYNNLGQKLIAKEKLIGDQIIELDKLSSGCYYIQFIINKDQFVASFYIIE